MIARRNAIGTARQRDPLAASRRTPNMPLPSPTATSTGDLSGRIVLVTGATGGLGSAVALACAAQRATLILHGRNNGKLEALYDAIIAAGHPQPTMLQLDLATAAAADFDAMAAAIRKDFGKLDALVHTAAFLGALGPTEHQTIDAWQSAMRVNVTGAFALTRAALPLLAIASDASITITLDHRGVDPRAYWGAYAASKAALGAFAATLADEAENRPNLRVNAVVPGAMRSPIRARTHPGEEKSTMHGPEALVPLYLYLVCGQTKAESGARIDVHAWRQGQPASVPLVASTTVG